MSLRLAKTLLLLLFVIRAMQAYPVSAIKDYFSSHLSSYDIIDSNWIKSKRSIGMEKRTIQFVAFNRTLRLVLMPTLSEAVGSNLHVSLMSNSSITIDSAYSTDIVHDFYSGYIEGDPGSRVRGYFAGNQLLCTIYTGNGEVLSIEPMSTFTGNLSETKLLVYYDSQIRDIPKSVPIACGNKDALPQTQAQSSASEHNQESIMSSSRRSSRSTSDGVTCSLQVVVDHAFSGRIGLGQVGSTMRTIVKIIDDVNEVFLATKLQDPMDKDRTLPRVGFELASVVIHIDADSSPGHYNAPITPKKLYDASQLLKAFDDIDEARVNLSSYCLNHLLTYRPMQRNVLGLARIAIPCSLGNVGLTSHCQTGGFPLLFRQAVLVTAHEIGHNMGSSHDPLGVLECMPEPSQGGPYLMHEKSVQGFEKNNNKFSPCSIKAISGVVKRALHTCLRKPLAGLCGNHRRDPGEDCDSGLSGDACCHSNCSLKSGAICSDIASPCCFKCKFAPRGAICLPESPLRPCRQPSRCSGVTFDCPFTSPPATDGTICNSGIGRCLAGVCQSVCHPSVECACPEPRHSCSMCCRSDGQQTCSPLVLAKSHGGAPMSLPVDWPCHSSRANDPRRCLSNGTCAASIVTGMFDDWVHGGGGGGGAGASDLPSGRAGVRLFRLSILYSGGSIASNNIVFITLIVTLIIYVPACLLCHYRDKQLVQADDEDQPNGDITFEVTHDNA